MSTAAITGHRPQSLDGDYSLSSELWNNIRSNLRYTFVEERVDHVYTGMALGVDTVAAQVSLQLEIPFTACVPFDGQERMWPEKSKREYRRLLDAAERVVVVIKGPYAVWKMQKRNEYMVNKLTEPEDLLIAVWNGKPGGTANCYRYAVKKEKNIKVITP